VGGGLAGLFAAALVARAGRSVVLLEQARHLGGRATTQVRDGVHFNLGPHALYRNGHAFALLRELGVKFHGSEPKPGRALLVTRDGTDLLPIGASSLLRMRGLSFREKLRFARFLQRLPKIDPRPLDAIASSRWLEEELGGGALAATLGAFFRLATYCADLDELSAGAAVEQLQSALAGNVWYVDGGWQSLVDGLRERALANGARIETGTRVEGVREESERVLLVVSNGAPVHARAIVVAVPPEEAAPLLALERDAVFARWFAERRSARAACLDLALSRLPRPRQRFALGLDRPHYFSVHSGAARLAPDGLVVAHAARYLVHGEAAGAADAAAIEKELEALVDAVQPGWRELVVARRFLPAMTVAPALPRASEGGRRGRPRVTLAGRPRLFLAGDWVGEPGLLADAAAASAREAAARAIVACARASAAGAGAS
jgi:phytoene dehydrogenase-like protein